MYECTYSVHTLSRLKRTSESACQVAALFAHSPSKGLDLCYGYEIHISLFSSAEAAVTLCPVRLKSARMTRAGGKCPSISIYRSEPEPNKRETRILSRAVISEQSLTIQTNAVETQCLAVQILTKLRSQHFAPPITTWHDCPTDTVPWSGGRCRKKSSLISVLPYPDTAGGPMANRGQKPCLCCELCRTFPATSLLRQLIFS